ncbi:uncharacterized protein [Excalfactoria chinensis]|uniref:uncharacterized protein n=1 Tax=Excalfactoria chinensis TaxID=46218 RepID=UPI003B3B353A
MAHKGPKVTELLPTGASRPREQCLPGLRVCALCCVPLCAPACGRRSAEGPRAAGGSGEKPAVCCGQEEQRLKEQRLKERSAPCGLLVIFGTRAALSYSAFPGGALRTGRQNPARDAALQQEAQLGPARRTERGALRFTAGGGRVREELPPGGRAGRCSTARLRGQLGGAPPSRPGPVPRRRSPGSGAGSALPPENRPDVSDEPWLSVSCTSRHQQHGLSAATASVLSSSAASCGTSIGWRGLAPRGPSVLQRCAVCHGLLHGTSSSSAAVSGVPASSTWSCPSSRHGDGDGRNRAGLGSGWGCGSARSLRCAGGLQGAASRWHAGNGNRAAEQRRLRAAQPAAHPAAHPALRRAPQPAAHRAARPAAPAQPQLLLRTGSRRSADEQTPRCAGGVITDERHEKERPVNELSGAFLLAPALVPHLARPGHTSVTRWLLAVPGGTAAGGAPDPSVLWSQSSARLVQCHPTPAAACTVPAGCPLCAGAVLQLTPAGGELLSAAALTLRPKFAVKPNGYTHPHF